MWRGHYVNLLPNGSQYCKRRLLVVFCKSEVGGKDTFPTCLELPCSNSLHSDYATFEITCGVSWSFVYIWVTLRRLSTSEAMFVDSMAVFLWVTSLDISLQVVHFKPKFVMLGWQHPETSEISSCIRTKRCPRIMYWVIPVVYLKVPDILMAPWLYSRLSFIELMDEVRANDSRRGFSMANKTCTEKSGCSCSFSNCKLTIIQGWLKEWAFWRYSVLTVKLSPKLMEHYKDVLRSGVTAARLQNLDNGWVWEFNITSRPFCPPVSNA
jgi:hypothetical protein